MISTTLCSRSLMCSVSSNSGLPNPQAMDRVPTHGQSGTGLHRRGASSSVFKSTPHHSYRSLTSHHHLSSASCQNSGGIMGFSRQEYWNGFPCPPPGNLPNPGIKPRSPSLQANSLWSESPENPIRFSEESKA